MLNIDGILHNLLLHTAATYKIIIDAYTTTCNALNPRSH